MDDSSRSIIIVEGKNSFKDNLLIMNHSYLYIKNNKIFICYFISKSSGNLTKNTNFQMPKVRRF